MVCVNTGVFVCEGGQQSDKPPTNKDKEECARVPSLAPPLKGAELKTSICVCLEVTFSHPCCANGRRTASAPAVGRSRRRRFQRTSSFKVGLDIDWGARMVDSVIITLAFLSTWQ